MRHVLFLIAALWLALPNVALAEETQRVQSVVDGDTVVLADGRQVRLPGLQAPKLPLGRKGFRQWPLADQSKAALEKLVADRTVRLRFGGARQDRHGRVLAHLYRDDGLWVQGEMLRLGLARMYTFADNRAFVPEMRAMEEEARRAGQGIWAHPFYAVRTPEAIGRDIGTFQIVAGKIVAAAKVKGTVYLNFGDDWRTDFTVKTDKRALKLFAKTGLKPETWSGRRVEVRGWVRKRNGPMIEATHPEQLFLLSE